MQKTAMGGVGGALPGRDFLSGVLRSYTRLLALLAAGILGFTLGIIDTGYTQLSNTRILAMGLHHGRIKAVSVAAPWYPSPWVAPPPELARKLMAALVAPRGRPSQIASRSPTDMLRVRYSDGFVVEAPVAPDGKKLYIFDYDPLNLLGFNWQLTHRTFVLPLQPLTRAEAEWMHDVTRHPVPRWVEAMRDRRPCKLPAAAERVPLPGPTRLRRR